MFSSERIFVRKKNQKEVSEESLNNVSFSSNNSFYEKLDIETKKDIIFLIKSGYDKRTIIKLYILIKPSNINEAVQYLTKENGKYQHIFYNSSKNRDICEICGEEKIIHIDDISKSISFSFNNIDLNLYNFNNNKIDVINIKNNKNICKICEEEITKEEEIENECGQCNNYFCSECLYLHIKELIKNGKYSLFCPECKFVYTKDRIDKILSFNIKDKEEIIKLKKLFKKSNTKQIILSNPELLFCPIANCEGFAKKNNNEDYNICTMGHKFCIKCGELWHNEGKCKEEENVDKLFEEFRNKYNLKNCPFCHIITYKNGGCNHMNCKYCNKHWCWLCQELFTSTEEHYGTRRSKCYNKMHDNLERLLCDKCENEIGNNDISRIFFKCGHRICGNCFKKHLLENNAMVLFPVKLLNCIVSGCKGYRLVRYKNIIDFIQDSNDAKLIKKYKASILFVEYGLQPFFQREYENYIEIYFYFADLFAKLFDCFRDYDIFYSILEIIGVIFGILFLVIFVAIVPIFFHFAIKKLYYLKLLPEIRNKYNKFIIFFIFLGEEILSLVFLFTLIAWHYIFSALFFPIMLLVLLIRNLIYGVEIC